MELYFTGQGFHTNSGATDYTATTSYELDIYDDYGNPIDSFTQTVTDYHFTGNVYGAPYWSQDASLAPQFTGVTSETHWQGSGTVFISPYTFTKGVSGNLELNACVWQ
jgi:hypothetical protein